MRARGLSSMPFGDALTCVPVCLLATEEQDKVLLEYGAKLQEAAGKILAAFRKSNADEALARTTSADSEPATPRSAGVPEDKIKEVSDFIHRDIEHAQAEFHKLAEARAEQEHHT